MKFTCTQENLNKGLFVVGHLANKNVNLPILNNVLLKAEQGILKLSTTNLEIGINCIVRGKIEKEGEFTIDSKLFSDYVNLLPKGNVEIDLADNEMLKVDCENYNTKIKGLAAADFPVIPQVEKKDPIVCNVNDFRTAIAQVIFAVSTNESRNELTGVLIDFNTFEPGKITLTATDSYRLAEKRIKHSVGQEEQTTVIVPAKTLSEVNRILSVYKDAIEAPENIEISLADNQIVFSYDNVELISRLIEGQYPDYKQIIPKDTKSKALVHNAALTKAVKTNSLFSQSGIFDINMSLSKQDGLKVSSTNAQVGENESKIDVEFEGDDNSIVVNYRYLLDGLQNINSDELSVELIDSNTPCILKSKEDEGYLYIIMPIKQ